MTYLTHGQADKPLPSRVRELSYPRRWSGSRQGGHWVDSLLPDSGSDYTRYSNTPPPSAAASGITEQTKLSYHHRSSACNSPAATPVKRDFWVMTSDDLEEESEDGQRSTNSARFNCWVCSVWCLLSLLLVGTLAAAFLQPFWLTNTAADRSLGLMQYCSSAKLKECHYYSRVGGPLDMVPSLSWKVTVVMYLVACLGMALGAFGSILCLFVGPPHKSRLCLISGYAQLCAVVLLITSLIIFPVGLDSPEAKSTCKAEGVFEYGTCSVGWSYLLAIGSAALSAFCPILSVYVDNPLGFTCRCGKK